MGDETGTERTLGAKLIAADEARTAGLRRSYAASVEDLWDAIIVSASAQPGDRPAP